MKNEVKKRAAWCTNFFNAMVHLSGPVLAPVLTALNTSLWCTNSRRQRRPFYFLVMQTPLTPRGRIFCGVRKLLCQPAQPSFLFYFWA